MASSLNIKDPQDFAVALLGALGAPDTKQNVEDVTAWVTSEGGNWHNTAKYNPLDTTEQEPGSVSYDTGAAVPGIQAYTSWSEGLEATVQTLQDSDPSYGYQAILDAIDGDEGWDALVAALKGSSWDGANHYAGNSVINDQYNPATQTSTPSTGDNNPDSGLYATGASNITSTDTTANSPSKTPGAKTLKGFAGILQTLDGWYNPAKPGVVSSISSLGFSDIEYTTILIFVRATSAILSVGLVWIGLQTMLHGSTDGAGGGGSPQNVLEFVNNSQQRNAAIAQSRTNSELSERRLRVQESEAARKAAKPKVKVKLVERGQLINE